MASNVNDKRPPLWKATRRGKTPNYKYKTLLEIYDESTPHNSTCNVYGIVTDFKEPAKSKGSDYFALIFIVDDTYHSLYQTPVRVRLFYGNPMFFPVVKLGDIVRLHRLKVYKQVDQLTLISSKGWSWVQWSAEDRDDPCKQEKSSSDSYTFLKSDQMMVDKLRDWQNKHSAEYADENNNFKRLSEINHDEHVSLLCKVLAFEQTSDTEIFAKVWDGTKPRKNFHRFEHVGYKHISTDIPEDFVVDVAIFNDHVAKWHELRILEGSYVLLRGLHAWTDPTNELNARTKACSELSLYRGTARGRGVQYAHDHELLLDKVQNDISAVRRETFGYIPEDESSMQLSTMQEKAKLMVSYPDINNGEDTPPLHLSPKKMRHSLGDGLISDDSDKSENGPGTSQTSTVKESPTVLRCLQESVTVITGEGMPHKLSTLKTVIKSHVAVNTSKLFRVRVYLKSCETPEEEYAGHYSPVTTIFYPSLNEGEALSISDDIKEFISAWREVRGPLQDKCTTPVRDSHSQWYIPSAGGDVNPVNMKRYKCTKDGSEWESMETGEHVIRKREDGIERFTILYILQNNEYTSESLKKYSSKYDRVIQLVPLALLTSQNPPTVGIQDGVFYYSCPASAVHPAVTSLQEEAEQFTKDRISRAAGSPALLPYFGLKFTLRDECDVLGKVRLVGKSAVEFFHDTSPQDYLINKDGVADEVKRRIDSLITGSNMFECIIEKKSRLQVKDKLPVYIYSIRSTALNID